MQIHKSLGHPRKDKGINNYTRTKLMRYWKKQHSMPHVHGERSNSIETFFGNSDIELW